MDRPEVPQYFTPPAFLTCIWPPLVLWHSCLRSLCLACIIEVSGLAQLPVLRVISRVRRSDFLYSFPLFHPKSSSAFQYSYGGRELSGQATREALSSKVNVLASAFCSQSNNRAPCLICSGSKDRHLLWDYSVLRCPVLQLGFLPVAAGMWPWVTSVSEPRGQHVQQSLRFVKLRNTPLAHVCPGLQCLWFLPGL